MATVTLNLPKYHAGQAEVYAGRRRFNVLACGRRWGKTKQEKRLAAETALAGDPVGWFAPDYKTLLEAWEELSATLKPIIGRSNATERMMRLMTGGLIEFWTLENPDAGRSRKYKRVIIDEAGLVAKLGDLWHAAIRPTLADLEGDAWLAGTPKGRNFFHEVYQRGQSEQWPEWQSWQLPTSANPYIKPGEIEAMRQEMPERKFAQEILAQFLDDAGGVFRHVRARSTGQPRQPYAGAHVMGVDWGKSNDYTVISVVDQVTRKQVYSERFNQIDYAVQRGRLQGVYEAWKPQLILAESNSIGEPNIEDLQRRGLPIVGFHTSNASKALIIEALVLGFETAAIEALNDETQIAELEAYEMTRTTTGLPKYGAPDGMHDDTVMSLALAWHAAVGFGTPGV